MNVQLAARQFNAEHVMNHGADILEAHGVPRGDAELVAESLVTSDIWVTRRTACCACPGTSPGCARVR